MIYILIVIVSFFLFRMIESETEENTEYPLILIDGKVAPRLSPLSFHIKNTTESNCLSCHLSAKTFTFNNKDYSSQKMPHIYREDCISCHIIEM
ncbi:MAG: hypothetical protein VX547_03435 [Candidatus Neomarinimicrobiota bacterium]|nr:hypothetical protein [Candidatus Neomarinimicrobiota bacterium]